VRLPRVLLSLLAIKKKEKGDKFNDVGRGLGFYSVDSL
jgi:hypothetical protein